MQKLINLFIVIIFAISPILLAAQTSGDQLSWSEKIKGDGMVNLGAGDIYMVVALEAKVPEILVLDLQKFHIINRIEKFRPEYQGNKLDFEKGIVFQNQLVIVANDKSQQYILRYSIPALTLLETISMGEVTPYIAAANQNGQFFEARIKNQVPPIQFAVSNNRENLLILFDNSGPERKQKVEYLFQSFNKNFTGSRSSAIIGINPTVYEPFNLIISDLSKAYILYQKTIETVGKSTYLFDLMNQKSYQWISDMSLISQYMVEENAEIFIGGICYQKGLFKVFTLRFNSIKLQFGEATFNEINLEKTFEYLDNSEIKKIKKDPYRTPILKFAVDGVRFLENGRMIMYGEYYSVVLLPASTMVTIRHETNEIFAIYLNSKGAIDQLSIIPKWHIFSNILSTNPAWGSYISYVKDDQIHFIFEDSPKNNESLPLKHSATDEFDKQTTAYTVNGEGVKTRTIWLNNKDRNIYPSPFISLDLGKGNYVIGSQSEDGFQFANLKY